jgi:hypothetical protein
MNTDKPLYQGIGSTELLADTTELYGAYYDSDPAVNPLMHNWNKVAIQYCDGASFAGNRETPYFSPNATRAGAPGIWFRGKALLRAVQDDLMTDKGMVRAAQGRLSALRIFLCKSVLYGAFVWARRALKHQKRLFPARAVQGPW